MAAHKLHYFCTEIGTEEKTKKKHRPEETAIELKEMKHGTGETKSFFLTSGISNWARERNSGVMTSKRKQCNRRWTDKGDVGDADEDDDAET